MNTDRAALHPLRILAAGLAAVLAFASTLLADAKLGIDPKRVVFEGRTRTAQFTLINMGDTAGTYRISFEQVAMDEDGALREVDADAPGQRPVADMIRYSPRQVTVPAGGSQTVRLMLQKPSELADGEYRSHMVFQLLPSAGDRDIENLVAPVDKTVKFSVAGLPATAVAVIVRHGNATATAKILGAEMTRGPAGDPRIRVRLQRDGNASFYGLLTASPATAEGVGEPIARIVNVAIYEPNVARTVEMPVRGELPVSGSLVIRLAAGEERKNPEPVSEFTLPIGGASPGVK